MSIQKVVYFSELSTIIEEDSNEELQPTGQTAKRPALATVFKNDPNQIPQMNGTMEWRRLCVAIKNQHVTVERGCQKRPDSKKKTNKPKTKQNLKIVPKLKDDEEN